MQRVTCILVLDFPYQFIFYCDFQIRLSNDRTLLVIEICTNKTISVQESLSGSELCIAENVKADTNIYFYFGVVFIGMNLCFRF